MQVTGILEQGRSSSSERHHMPGYWTNASKSPGQMVPQMLTTTQLGDAGGVVISDNLVIDQPDGTDKRIDWTLESYMQVTRIKYQSKARFNVLMKRPMSPISKLTAIVVQLYLLEDISGCLSVANRHLCIIAIVTPLIVSIDCLFPSQLLR